jgi:hypothetical protein
MQLDGKRKWVARASRDDFIVPPNPSFFIKSAGHKFCVPFSVSAYQVPPGYQGGSHQETLYS